MSRRRAAALSAALLFVPIALAAQDEDLVHLLREGRYHEAYEAVAGREGDRNPALRDAALAVLGTSMESDDSYTRWFALRAAQPLADAGLAPYARVAMNKGDRYDKSLALDLVAKLDPAGSREELVAALESHFRSIRLRALQGLATLRDPALAPSFTEVLSKDPDPDLRSLAVRALAMTGSPQAPAGLYRALEDSVATVQEEAVQALVRLRSPGVTGVLQRRLADAPPEERVRAIRLASFAANPDLIGDLGPYLGDGDPEVRAFAAAAILAIADRAARAEE